MLHPARAEGLGKYKQISQAIQKNQFSDHIQRIRFCISGTRSSKRLSLACPEKKGIWKVYTTGTDRKYAVISAIKSVLIFVKISINLYSNYLILHDRVCQD